MSRRNGNRVNPNAPVATADLPVTAAPAPLAITEDDRAMLLGFDGRRQAVILAARGQIAALEGEQVAYMARIAARLGVDPGRLGPGCSIDLDALTITPSPAKEATP